MVDYVGDHYDTSEVWELLDRWPVGEKLDFDRFAAIGDPFVELGDRESDRRQKCRFSMNYFFEDFETPLSVLTDQFEQFFFRQSRMTNSEFERLLIESGD